MPQLIPGGQGAVGLTINHHDYYSEPSEYGRYQYLSMFDLINGFMAAYVGEGKILANTNRADVSFHAHRAFQELHYDTFTSCKSQEIILPPSLTMRLPHDYVNYTKITWSDSNGIEHIIYPTSKTSKGNKIQQDADGNYLMTYASYSKGELLQDNPTSQSSYAQELQINTATFLPLATTFDIDFAVEEGYGINTTTGNLIPKPPEEPVFKVGMEIQNKIFPIGTTITAVTMTINANGSVTNTITTSNASINFPASWNSGGNKKIVVIDNTGDTTWGKYKGSSSTSTSGSDQYFSNLGQRFGLEPQHAQTNGSFFIDHQKGLIHFSSNISGKSIILHYLSDGVATMNEIIIPKLAEEAMYKWIAYGCLSALANVPENLVQRYKKEKFAETRKAKLRLSNIKIEEITQIMRGKSKIIKH